MTDISGFDGGLDGQDIADIGFYCWNVPENLVHGDEVIADIFGVSVDELTKGAPIQHVIRHVDDGDKQRLAKAIHEAIVSGMPFLSEYRVTHPNGRKIHVRANGRCLRDAEGVPSTYSGTVTIQPVAAIAEDPLESHCLAALRIATKHRNQLAARYLSSALNTLGRKTG